MSPRAWSSIASASRAGPSGPSNCRSRSPGSPRVSKDRLGSRVCGSEAVWKRWTVTRSSPAPMPAARRRCRAAGQQVRGQGARVEDVAAGQPALHTPTGQRLRAVDRHLPDERIGRRQPRRTAQRGGRPGARPHRCRADQPVPPDLTPVHLAGGELLDPRARPTRDQPAGRRHQRDPGRPAHPGEHQGHAADDHRAGGQVLPVLADPVGRLGERVPAQLVAVGAQLRVGDRAQAERVGAADRVVAGVVVRVAGPGRPGHRAAADPGSGTRAWPGRTPGCAARSARRTPARRGSPGRARHAPARPTRPARHRRCPASRRETARPRADHRPVAQPAGVAAVPEHGRPSTSASSPSASTETLPASLRRTESQPSVRADAVRRDAPGGRTRRTRRWYRRARSAARPRRSVHASTAVADQPTGRVVGEGLVAGLDQLPGGVVGGRTRSVRPR